MKRRDFLTGVLAAGSAAMLPGVSGCASSPARRADGSPEPEPVDAMLAAGARTMWIAAHPDDECFCGTLLARSSIHYGNPLSLLVLTRGDGGECCRPEGCRPDVATVREGEMRRVAALYRADLQLESYWNAPLPVESFPPREKLWEKWLAAGDPVAKAAEAVRRFRPDVIFTFAPTFGATGHPEHQLTSRIATAAVRRAADASVAIAGLRPHRVTRTYYLLNRYWLLRAAGAADPEETTETFDAYLPCAPGLSCLDFMCQATREHCTQENDMGTVRRFRTAFATVNLRQVDPFTDIRPVDEPAAKA